jgi:23S rRNA (adenine2503-C2)-methyltransferase
MIEKVYHVPTGEIAVMRGQHGLLECLSLGDYGQDQNLKADFLGLTREIEGVPNGDVMPLEKKWVVTISTQYGCSMGCNFCDVPDVGPGRNATFQDMLSQVMYAMDLHKDVPHTERLNLHFARMGEPTFNWDVINVATYLAGIFAERGWPFHPVVSTMMPRANRIRDFLQAWMHVKNVICDGNAGLQLSINSTNEEERDEMFGGMALTLEEIAWRVGHFKVEGRKIALNFALGPDYTVNARRLGELFDPKRFLCKLTPLHITRRVLDRELVDINDYRNSYYDHYYPYKATEKALKDMGYDVIVFVPSLEEDKGRITCGNALLSGSVPEVTHRITDHTKRR